MEKPITENLNYALREDVEHGSVRIADDVVAMIAGIAALEVEGVHAMAGNVGNGIFRKVGLRNPQKGVRVSIVDKNVTADASIIVDYGYNIPTVSQKAQDRIKQMIESMTGLEVTDVNIRVAGVNLQAK
ncbi:MAG: Asp23/Gls24 family envelope stress response protein [Lachnospiraceae bacterium]|nr:Asp23/Gls24 family envelope stress response protein [Lachnospiraceae bacterium]